MAYTNATDFEDDFRKVGADATAALEPAGSRSNPTEYASSENLQAAPKTDTDLMDDDLEDDEDLDDEDEDDEEDDLEDDEDDEDEDDLDDEDDEDDEDEYDDEDDEDEDEEDDEDDVK